MRFDDGEEVTVTVAYDCGPDVAHILDSARKIVLAHLEMCSGHMFLTYISLHELPISRTHFLGESKDQMLSSKDSH